MAQFPKSFAGLREGYTDPEVKKKFLSMGTRMLARVGRKLVAEGLLEDCDARSNAGGIAVSGESYGHFYLSDRAAVHLQIDSSSVSFGGRGRSDGVTVMAQYRVVRDEDLRRHRGGKANKRPYAGKDVGGNVWMDVSAGISDETVEAFLVKTIKNHPEWSVAKARLEAKTLLERAGAAETGVAKESPSL